MLYWNAMEKNLSRRTGVAVPLGALRTQKCPVIGEFCALKEFAAFCKQSGLQIIQLLPVNDSGTESSPYSALTAFALHPAYITVQDVEGYGAMPALQEEYNEFLERHRAAPRYDYPRIVRSKTAFLRRIYDTLCQQNAEAVQAECGTFAMQNPWVEEYALFKRLKEMHRQAGWKHWPKAFAALSEEEQNELFSSPETRRELQFYIWCQIQAFAQFDKAASAVRAEGILLKGDIPFLVNMDSDCVWSHRNCFDTKVTVGCPPDADNRNGQNWGFPCYRWKNNKRDIFLWWKLRIALNARFFDACRLDHALGFFRTWSIPVTELRATMGCCAPAKPFTRAELRRHFSDERIRWLSRPHVPTQRVCELSGKSHEEVSGILPEFLDRIGDEELWLFKKKFTGSRDVLAAGGNSASFRQKIAEILSDCWEDRTLLEIEPNKFVPKWNCTDTSAWRSLSDAEKDALRALFRKSATAEEKLWAKNANEILAELAASSSMVLCAEDLGVGIACVQEVLKKRGIMGLKVVRWERQWSKTGQPFTEFARYNPLSVATTSVHDSSTLRQWWNSEKDSVQAFIDVCSPPSAQKDKPAKQERFPDADSEFNPRIAQYVLEHAAECASRWFINPLQDYLHLDKAYYAAEQGDERVNVPGTVSPFNWTYRMPCLIEDLLHNTKLTNKISGIVRIHNQPPKKEQA